MYLYDLKVKKEYRGKHVGTMLIEKDVLLEILSIVVYTQ